MGMESSEQDAPVRIARLVEVTEGDIEFERLLVQAFLEDGVAHICALDAAVPAGQAQEIHRHTHALKGSAGNLGADRLSALATVLDDAARHGILDDTHAQYAALRAEFERVQAWFARRFETKS